MPVPAGAAGLFTRTLAVGLGEVRQPPSSAQCLRAASTARTLLGGYFPQFAAAFPCQTPLPGILGSLGSVKPLPQLALGNAESCPADQSSREVLDLDLDEPQPVNPCVAQGEDPDEVRTSVVATLLAREYGPKMQRIESRCMSLYASNQQLQLEAATEKAKSDKARELNRRLCKEVNDARCERTAAVEELDRMHKQMQQMSEEIRKVKASNSSLKAALKSSQSLNLELRESLQKVQISSVEDAAEDVFENIVGSEVCSCNSTLRESWGCPVHQVYSGNLLLAHKQIAAKVARGPPGLEIQTPPGLEFTGPCSPCNPLGLTVAVR